MLQFHIETRVNLIKNFNKEDNSPDSHLGNIPLLPLAIHTLKVFYLRHAFYARSETVTASLWPEIYFESCKLRIVSYDRQL